MTIPPALITLLVGMALVITGLGVGYKVPLLPIDASTNAPVYDDLFRVLFSIGTILFLGVVGLLVFSLVRFRRRRGDLGDGVAVEGNLPLEIVWTAIPAVVVLFVGIYSYDIYERMGGMAPLTGHEAMHHEAVMASAVVTPAAVIHTSGEGEPAPPTEGAAPNPTERLWGGIASDPGDVLPVEVTAMQFAFIFHYPESDITSGELHVPTGRPVQLRMKANDVIHAFWVPQFRIKQDVIPGQPTVLTFTATRPGSYPIVCAELCGPYHGGMRTTVVVHEEDSYQDWVGSHAPPPTPATPPTTA